MISRQDEGKVKRLLSKTTLSQRSIARVVGLTRYKVGRIARGEYDSENESESISVVTEKGSYRQCPICRAKVLMPCLACRVREIKRNGSVPSCLKN